MAGDWIKVRCDLPDDVAVVAIAGATNTDPDAVVGKLVRLWTFVTLQTNNGHAPGVTRKWVDAHVGCDGFAAAMISAGWLEIDDDGLTIPDYDAHNGPTAKARAKAAIRQRRARAKRDAGHTKGVTPSVTKAQPGRDVSRPTRLEITDKTTTTDPAPAGDAAAVSALLQMAGGFDPTTADTLATECGGDLAQAKVAIRNADQLERAGKLQNRRGYIRRALLERYAPATATVATDKEVAAAEARQKRETREEAERAEQRKHAERSKAERAATVAFAAQLSDADLHTHREQILADHAKSSSLTIAYGGEPARENMILVAEIRRRMNGANTADLLGAAN